MALLLHLSYHGRAEYRRKIMLVAVYGYIERHICVSLVAEYPHGIGHNQTSMETIKI
jgi:hypothetical protein